jgi:putative ABC transport system substrate-binding protein
VIGFLNSFSPKEWAPYLVEFHRGINEGGFVENQNVKVEYRWAQSELERLPGLAAELVRLPVAVLVASGGDQAVLAARSATTTIPIVSSIAFDPVDYGIIKSLARPGGNVTGVSLFTSVLVAKRIALLHELLPNVSTIAFLANPTNPAASTDVSVVEAAAKSVGKQVVVVNAASERECEAAFETAVRLGAGALSIEADPFYVRMREQLVALAARFKLPVIYHWREFVTAGGLIGYASSLTDAYRQLGSYTGRVLKGAKPADLPVVQPTKFELVINLKTARTLGLEIPPNLLALADEVIE